MGQKNSRSFRLWVSQDLSPKLEDGWFALWKRLLTQAVSLMIMILAVVMVSSPSCYCSRSYSGQLHGNPTLSLDDGVNCCASSPPSSLPPPPLLLSSPSASLSSHPSVSLFPPNTVVAVISSVIVIVPSMMCWELVMKDGMVYTVSRT